MWLRWRRFGQNTRKAGGEAAPLVRTVRAADVAPRAVAVVAPGPVHRVVAAVATAADVRRYGSVADLWRMIVDGRGVEPLPVLVVLAQDAAASPQDLATAIAYLAPRTSVVLLHRAGELEALGETYLRVVAAHRDDCDPDAPVEVAATPATGAGLVAALRAAAPDGLAIGDCPPALAGPVDEPPTPPRSGPRPPETAARAAAPVVIAVAGAKGGAGKSTTAVALAATVARIRPGTRVCLVDLDIRDGQLAALLDLTGPTVTDLCADANGITDATVLAHLARDDRLGVHALLAPPTCHDEPELLTGRVHRKALAVLRRHFDLIVLDCPVTYREPLLAGTAFVDADRIVAVTTLAVTSLAGVERMLRTLAAPAADGGLGVPRRKFAVAVNGALNGVAVDRAQVAARTLGLLLAAVVPHAARDVLIATNTHRLDRLIDHPDLGPAYRALADWALTADVPVGLGHAASAGRDAAGAGRAALRQVPGLEHRGWTPASRHEHLRVTLPIRESIASGLS
jgi:Mrp family chromosome partitioning ATPase